MKQIIRLFASKFSRTFAREDGNASVEFVLLIPVVFAIFTASLETSVVMLRSNMLQHALDTTMRDLRLGSLVNPTQGSLKTLICGKMSLANECDTSLVIEIVPISNWVMPANGTACVNKAAAVTPVTTVNIGQRNDLMMIRVCLVQDLVYPTSGLSLSLPVDANGDYHILAVSAYVNEPA